MITILVEDCNDFSQDFYDSTVAAIHISDEKCSCGSKGCLIRYGHYTRSVKFMSELIPLSMQRVRCTDCGVTHAISLSTIVPYSQTSLPDQQEIIGHVVNGTSPAPVMEQNTLIDENNVKYIVRQYKKHWAQILLFLGKTLKDSLAEPCLRTFSRQFMQNRRTANILCTSTNIPLPDIPPGN